MEKPVGQVEALRDSSGAAQLYRCPQCRKSFQLQEQADACLRNHAQLLED